MGTVSYPKGKALIELFIKTFDNYPGFEVLEKGTFCLFKFDGDLFYAYFKCVTHEGNPYPLEHQRAQLPQRPEFDKVIESDIPFLFIGYDVANDVYVCWEPHKVKSRLNKKSYVSFYSRLSAQENVLEGKVQEERLTNGDKFILFKRTDIISFLKMINTHFPELATNNVSSHSADENSSSSISQDIQGRLKSVEDDISVKLLVDSFLAENAPRLAIIGECMSQYGDYYCRMSFADWGRIVRGYLDTKTDE